jgi:hypothetical protein
MKGKGVERKGGKRIERENRESEGMEVKVVSKGKKDGRKGDHHRKLKAEM